jgi:hypothetical protein
MNSSKRKPRDIQPGQQFHAEGHWWTLVGHSHREDHSDIQHWWVNATNELGHRHIFQLYDSDDAVPNNLSPPAARSLIDIGDTTSGHHTEQQHRSDAHRLGWCAPVILETGLPVAQAADACA